MDYSYLTRLICLRSLPGSVVERQLQASLARMFPELMRFSSARSLLDNVLPELRNAHRTSAALACVPESSAPAPRNSIWEDWGDRVSGPPRSYEGDDDGLDLDEMGL